MTQEMIDTLASLNQSVDEAIKARKAWLDSKIVEVSKLHVGDDIYNLETGRRLGTVTNLYRFWEDADEGVRDKYLSVDYQYCEDLDDPRGKSYDNTSRQTGIFGTREDAAKWMIRRAEELQVKLQIA